MLDTFLAFLIASVLTLFFVRRYLKTLTVPKRAAAPPQKAAPQTAAPAIACPRCGRSIAGESSFCSACGAPLALWSVHRAAVQSAPEGAAGTKANEKPRPVINATLCIGCGSCVDACPETGTLALAGGKAILAHPERCVGHARCVDVCPTSAISLAFGSKL